MLKLIFLIINTSLLMKALTEQFSTCIMPVLFIGHGNPMNAIEQNKNTEGWRKIAKIIPKPKTILCISAHWQTSGSFVTAMSKPKTIHDFGGFPDKLFKVQYPAPGAPQIANEIYQKLKGIGVQMDKNKWGLDHGTWSILVKMYPNADIPVLQLSMNTQFKLKQHYQFAKNLSWLRRQGVLIIGSGNIIHNLGLITWNNPNAKLPWAEKVRQKTNQLILSKQHNKLINYKQNGQQFVKAINSQQHYIPLLYCLGLQQQSDQITIWNDNFDLGSLSMTSLLIVDKNSTCHSQFK